MKAKYDTDKPLYKWRHEHLIVLYQVDEERKMIAPLAAFDDRIDGAEDEAIERLKDD